MNGAVAAGHPLTAEAGARILAEGGNAVDACVAAAFTSWVAESPLTGPGAGGFVLVHRAYDRSTRLLDCFAAVPGVGLPPHDRPEMETIDIDFVGERLVLCDLAATLELLAERGAGELYRGDLAAAIAAYSQENGGDVTRDDLATYRVITRRPVRAPFRGHEFVSNPPPSSGGVLI